MRALVCSGYGCDVDLFGGVGFAVFSSGVVFFIDGLCSFGALGVGCLPLFSRLRCNADPLLRSEGFVGC